MSVQSVLIPRGKFDLVQAKRWLVDNDFVVKKVDITTNYYRFRQFEPSDNCNYRMKKLSNGIKLVLCFK